MEVIISEDTDFGDITRLYYKLYPEKETSGIVRFEGVDFQKEIFLAKQEGKVVGFIITTFISYLKSKSGYIEELFVDPDFRLKGIGNALVDKSLDWQNRLGSEVVFVTTDEAQEFYKKVGFRELSRNSWLCWVPNK